MTLLSFQKNYNCNKIIIQIIVHPVKEYTTPCQHPTLYFCLQHLVDNLVQPFPYQMVEGISRSDRFVFYHSKVE